MTHPRYRVPVAPSLAMHQFLARTTTDELLEELTKREAFGRAAELSPTDARAEGGRGMVYHAREEYEHAAERFQHARVSCGAAWQALNLPYRHAKEARDGQSCGRTTVPR